MKRAFCGVDYSTHLFSDEAAGCVGLEPGANSRGAATKVGKISFWEASGQFVIELKAGEHPLEIIEEFISEARQTIRVK